MSSTLAQEVVLVYILWTMLISMREFVVYSSILNIFSATDIPNDGFMRPLLQLINVVEIVSTHQPKITKIWLHVLGVSSVSKIIKSIKNMNSPGLMTTSLTIQSGILTEWSASCNVTFRGWSFQTYSITDKQCMEENWHVSLYQVPI